MRGMRKEYEKGRCSMGRGGRSFTYVINIFGNEQLALKIFG
jgi:hypothetical protein